MYKYSNLGAICAKGLCGDESIDKTWKNKVWLVLDSLVLYMYMVQCLNVYDVGMHYYKALDCKTSKVPTSRITFMQSQSHSQYFSKYLLK